ncbi:mRNA-capping enzyme subunit beta [Mortierella polycephala]|uniref:mRNA-capping enzyme subunit beta n=1 Tax=Mortierella polycephala TaxID=41804 RepID=A0A9P6QC48_9FUNG|nr:mRNA-capping enzyme subunit beta [Mortierella polycephala]
MSDQASARKRPLDEEQNSQAPVAATATASNESQEPENTDKPPFKKARPEEDATSISTSSASSRTKTHPQQPQASEQRRSTQPQHQQQQLQLPRRHPSFFGADVLDDVVRTIGEFLFEHCHHANIEIEAKLGLLIDKGTKQRINMGVMNEVVLASNQGRPAWYQFSSDMTTEQHAHFNRVLNKRMEQMRNEPREHQPMYTHTREVDQFFNSRNGKVRVTRDQGTNEIIKDGIVRKERIADLDVFSPKNPFDFRVSVNIEVPVDPPEGTLQYERRKDRVSYRYGNFKIDLTQVKTPNTPGGGGSGGPPNYSQMRPTNNNPQENITHELEIEFVHAEELARERETRISSSGRKQDRFMDVVGLFVSNIRGLLVRGNAQQLHPQPPPHQRQQYPHQQRQ